MAQTVSIKFGLEEIEQVALHHLLPLLSQYSIFAFYGPLGAGKTTLIREILRLSGICEPITSPTFTYVKRYTTLEGQIFYHFDLYRINFIEEFLASGFDEYLYEEKVNCLIEWPEVIELLLSDEVLQGMVCKMKIGYTSDDVHRRWLKILTPE